MQFENLEKFEHLLQTVDQINAILKGFNARREADGALGGRNKTKRQSSSVEAFGDVSESRETSPFSSSPISPSPHVELSSMFKRKRSSGSRISLSDDEKPSNRFLDDDKIRRRSERVLLEGQIPAPVVGLMMDKAIDSLETNILKNIEELVRSHLIIRKKLQTAETNYEEISEHLASQEGENRDLSAKVLNKEQCIKNLEAQIRNTNFDGEGTEKNTNLIALTKENEELILKLRDLRQQISRQQKQNIGRKTILTRSKPFMHISEQSYDSSPEARFKIEKLPLPQRTSVTDSLVPDLHDLIEINYALESRRQDEGEKVRKLEEETATLYRNLAAAEKEKNDAIDMLENSKLENKNLVLEGKRIIREEYEKRVKELQKELDTKEQNLLEASLLWAQIRGRIEVLETARREFQFHMDNIADMNTTLLEVEEGLSLKLEHNGLYLEDVLASRRKLRDVMLSAFNLVEEKIKESHKGYIDNEEKINEELSFEEVSKLEDESQSVANLRSSLEELKAKQASLAALAFAGLKGLENSYEDIDDENAKVALHVEAGEGSRRRLVQLCETLALIIEEGETQIKRYMGREYVPVNGKIEW
eukprot:GHVP01058114.1.p3 GENE.GHVP01058114.1~~GHVP01058114.1.p3  ORF type:complete len:591 (-),score=141.97 GHVP01058114.1:3509-5281(-)